MAATALTVGAGLTLGGPAVAQAPEEEGVDTGAEETNEGVPSDVSDEDLALQEELFAIIVEALEEAEVDSSGAPIITGEAGDHDLPPGESLYTGVIEASSASDLPDSGASSLTGPCRGMAISFRPDGSVLDMASDFNGPGAPVDLLESDLEAGDLTQAFTAENPFLVHVDGFVVYAGRTTTPPIDHRWSIDTQGVSLDSGGDPNGDRESNNAGVVNLKEDFPEPKISALFKIDGDMTANDDFRCTGSGYFRTIGGLPVLGGVGLIAVFAAGAGALFNARPARTW